MIFPFGYERKFVAREVSQEEREKLMVWFIEWRKQFQKEEV
jgi:hypothetical protein